MNRNTENCTKLPYTFSINNWQNQLWGIGEDASSPSRFSIDRYAVRGRGERDECPHHALVSAIWPLS